MKTSFDKLIGKIISQIWIDTEKTRLLFLLGDSGQESQFYYANGDCCSRSWFEHVEGVEVTLKQSARWNTINSTVTSVEEISMSEVSVTEEYGHISEVIQAYGFKIHTSKGTITIEMRNESNGYYGGEVEEGLVGQYGLLYGSESFSFSRIQKDF